MTMKIFALLVTPIFLFAKVHYAKVEPYESFSVKSSVGALVLDTNLDAEGRVFSGSVVMLDDKLDRLNLKASKKNILNLKSMLEINRDMLEIQQKSYQNNEEYFNRISKLSTISKTQKDDSFTQYTTSKTQYLLTKEKIINLEKQIIDLNYKVDQLKDILTKKNITVNNKFIVDILVTPGDYVNPSTKLLNIVDLNSAKITLYLDSDELGLDKKSIYIDDKLTEYKIDKLWKVADEKFISSYKAEIFIDKKYGFSNLVKIEIK